MRDILLDTHVFLWAQAEPEKLPSKLLGLFAREDVCWHLSQVSVWEIQVKHSLGKLPLPEAPKDWLPEVIEKSGVAYCRLEDEAIFMLGKLPAVHRDPFDRLLIATAIVNGWEIATVDSKIEQYAVITVS